MSHLLVLGLVVCTSALFGLLLNFYILVVLVYNRQVRTANNLLLLHLALVDIASCVELLAVSGPSTAATAMSRGGAAQLPPPLCVLHGFVWTALLPIAVWTLCGLNCDRYAAIASPLHYSRLVRSNRIVVFLAVTWAVGVSLALPPLFRVNRYTYRVEHAMCLADFTDRASGHWYALAYACLAVVLPAFLIIFCNVRILAIARHHRHRIVSAIYEVTVRAQATITHQRNPFYLSKYKGRSAVITIVQLLGSLVVLYGPHCGTALWEMCTGRRSALAWAAVALGLVACAAPVNGFVYGIKSPVLRKAFKNFLRRQLYTSEVRQEIHQRRGSLSGRAWSSVPLRAPPTSCNNNGGGGGDGDDGTSPATHMCRSEFFLPLTQLPTSSEEETFQVEEPTPPAVWHDSSTPAPFTDPVGRHRCSPPPPLPSNRVTRRPDTACADHGYTVSCCPEDDDDDVTPFAASTAAARDASPPSDAVQLLPATGNGHCCMLLAPVDERDLPPPSNRFSGGGRRPPKDDRNTFINFDLRLQNGSFVKRSLQRVFSPPPPPPTFLCERGSI